jgi:MarR family transcriptional regulator, transcriptional regulator for hemolysin
MQPDRGATWQPEATATYWINRASRALSRHLDAELRPFGFALGQMPVLRALAGGEARSQAELARIAQVEQPSMAETLARMVRDGVVDRQPDPRDGRASLVSLSRRSRQRLAGARRALMTADAKAMAGVSGEDLAAICAVLQRIVENVERLAADDRGAVRAQPGEHVRRRSAKPRRKDSSWATSRS